VYQPVRLPAILLATLSQLVNSVDEGERTSERMSATSNFVWPQALRTKAVQGRTHSPVDLCGLNNLYSCPSHEHQQKVPSRSLKFFLIPVQDQRAGPSSPGSSQSGNTSMIRLNPASGDESIASLGLGLLNDLDHLSGFVAATRHREEIVTHDPQLDAKLVAQPRQLLEKGRRWSDHHDMAHSSHIRTCPVLTVSIEVFELRCHVNIATGNHFEGGHEQNTNIQCERLLLNILNVEVQAFFPRQAIASADLGEPSDTRQN
jgi:hypothetical protein